MANIRSTRVFETKRNTLYRTASVIFGVSDMVFGACVRNCSTIFSIEIGVGVMYVSYVIYKFCK